MFNFLSNSPVERQRQIVSIISIPFFLILLYYLHNKQDKTNIEKVLYLFSLAGLLFELYFTSDVLGLFGQKNSKISPSLSLGGNDKGQHELSEFDNDEYFW